ncbi:MAG: bifunctional protein-serine/threonine kinase/phosphatase [Gammaproteobacteria bacterium]|nr:bifunctional protein-serine/threonine kinase/phosphatase [Gammaproteobacteria bacterium]
MPMHLQSEIRLSQAHISQTGRKHRNEDCLGFFAPQDNLLTTKGACAIIADGVSSAEAGGEAADLCVTEFINDYFDTPDIWTVKKSAQKVLTAINRSLYSRSHEYLDSRGWLCTLSVLIIKSHTAHIFHIGDSRIYRIRDQHMECLTTDHLAPLSKSNSCLARAMGMDTRLDLDYRSLTAEPGDLFLLSTDGIHDYLDPQEVLAIIEQNKDLDLACELLAQTAFDAGSGDNLSCQLVRVDELIADHIDDLTDRLTTLPFPPDLSPGMTMDGYEILAEIYASSRSQLYHVKDVETKKEWVMKTPSPNYDDDPGYIERFIMEEWVGSRIASPHVVKIGGINKPKSFLYYLMDKVEGITLEQWIEANPFPRPSMAIEIIKQIAAGLNAFHKRETLHQDLKPGNIMIRTQPELHVTLVDFGSVYVAGVDEIFVPMERDRMLGTLHYADPLLRLGHNTGIQGDLFSLASITYEIFTNHLPYGTALEHCDTPAQLGKLRYIPADRYNPIVPIWFDRALRKALNPELSQRYQDLATFMQDLTHPNPDFVYDRTTQQQSNKVIFWQVISLVWFIVTVFLIGALWLT